jgi:dipeptidyl aminopeptidase/acylaminoacyl peptidase
VCSLPWFAAVLPWYLYRPGSRSRRTRRRTAKKDQKKDEKKTLELQPERKIEFSTDEGTWLSLDISPDGRTIVFELLGEIYTLPVEGGQAKLISGGMPFDSQPRFSPDGKWIAFLSDRDGGENVWIMKSDGSDPKQLSKETWANFASPSWTPDSSYVLVSKLRKPFPLVNSGCIRYREGPAFKSPRRKRRQSSLAVNAPTP